MNILKKAKELCIASDSQLLYLTRFGSHLYGTATDDSDSDYIGIYMPSHDSCYCHTQQRQLTFKTAKEHTQNTKEDVDLTLWSIQQFMYLLSKQDINALSVLYSHTNKDCVLYRDDQTSNLFKNHNRLYSLTYKTPSIDFATKQMMIHHKADTYDWKSLSHAVRTLTQVLLLCDTGKISYPLYNCEDLKDIKAGLWSWGDDSSFRGNVVNHLINLRYEIGEKKDKLPSGYDKNFVKKCICSFYNMY